MNKILLIGPNFHYFLSSIELAFKQIGYQVFVCPYDNPIHPYNAINAIRYKISKDKLRLKESSRCNFRNYVEEIFKIVEPSITIIINGDNLCPSSVKLFSESSKVGIWLFDSVQRVTDCLPILSYAHKVFCYEKEDISFIKAKCGIDAFFLPQAASQLLYNKLNLEKKWDIVFAGDIFNSKKRRKIIPNVVNRYSNLSVCIWGVYKPIYKGLKNWLTRERKDVYRNCNASVVQLNVDYNKSRIVLNVHHEQQKNGANPKVFEIAMSGAYQICDANPYIEELFPNGEIGIYHDEQELYELIDYALNHDMSEHAEKAYQIVIKEHTFVCRVKQILELLNT